MRLDQPEDHALVGLELESLQLDLAGVSRGVRGQLQDGAVAAVLAEGKPHAARAEVQRDEKFLFLLPNEAEQLWRGLDVALRARLKGADPGSQPDKAAHEAQRGRGVLLLLVLAGRDALAFGLSAAGILAASAAIFSALFPRVMVSRGPGPSLTIWSAASAHTTLLVMTVVAAIFVPFVLGYQGWSYWVFRQRLIRPAQQPSPAPAARSPQAGRHIRSPR